MKPQVITANEYLRELERLSVSSVEAFQKVRMRLPAHLRAQINEHEDHIYICAETFYLSSNVTVSI